MFNILSSIQSQRKSSLHPKPCPEPGGSSGYPCHCVPVPVDRSRRRSCCRRSIPCLNHARGTVGQGTWGPGMGLEQVLLSHTCGSSWGWLQPLRHHACRGNTHRCYRSGSPRKDLEWIFLGFSTPFSCLAAGLMPRNKTFYKLWVLVFFLFFFLILHFGVDIHLCLIEKPNSHFWKFCRLTS